MKTILIIIAGMADLPDPFSLRDTPLATATIPSLHLLSQRGEFSSFPSIGEDDPISHVNALLSLLGYDLKRGEPSVEELMEYGLNSSASLSDFSTLRPFVIPGFSGHGVCITTSAWVRGAAKCAQLKPLDIYSPGSSDSEILETQEALTRKAIMENEFVLIYLDSPLKASLRGDFDRKVKNIESIDRHLINPVADFVWKSDMMINLAITTDLVTPWHRRRPSKVNVPVVTYFNNDDWDGNPEMRFTEVNSMLNIQSFYDPSSLIKYLCYFNAGEDEDTESGM